MNRLLLVCLLVTALSGCGETAKDVEPRPADDVKPDPTLKRGVLGSQEKQPADAPVRTRPPKGELPK